jgi:hypothetical protein
MLSDEFCVVMLSVIMLSVVALFIAVEAINDNFKVTVMIIQRINSIQFKGQRPTIWVCIHKTFF